jgi:hypothetical protein
MNHDSKLLESVWAYREETLYPQLFGPAGREGIFPLAADTFARLGHHEIDPRWLHLGVFEFQPGPSRSSWLYATSGGSTPWDEVDEGFSWLGIEYVFETTVQADWPIVLLQRLLAYHVLVAHGRFGEFPVPAYGHRIPAGGAIDGAGSQLRFLAIAPPRQFPAEAQLGSGKFEFLQAIGISEAERDFAKGASTQELLDLLYRQGAAPITDPRRASVV